MQTREMIGTAAVLHLCELNAFIAWVSCIPAVVGHGVLRTHMNASDGVSQDYQRDNSLLECGLFLSSELENDVPSQSKRQSHSAVTVECGDYEKRWMPRKGKWGLRGAQRVPGGKRHTGSTLPNQAVMWHQQQGDLEWSQSPLPPLGNHSVSRVPNIFLPHAVQS